MYKPNPIMAYILLTLRLGIASLGLFSFGSLFPTFGGSLGDGILGRFMPVSRGDPNAVFSSVISLFRRAISFFADSR
jgi:hypothetical protein